VHSRISGGVPIEIVMYIYYKPLVLILEKNLHIKRIIETELKPGIKDLTGFNSNKNRR
jgi:hypothetical protein